MFLGVRGAPGSGVASGAIVPCLKPIEFWNTYESAIFKDALALEIILFTPWFVTAPYTIGEHVLQLIRTAADR